MDTSPTFPRAYAFFWALVMLIGAALVSAVALLLIGKFLETLPYEATTSGWGLAVSGLVALGVLGSLYAAIRAYRSVRHRGLRSPYPNAGIILTCIGLFVLMWLFFLTFQT